MGNDLDPIRLACLETVEGLRERIPGHGVFDERTDEGSYAHLWWMANEVISMIETWPIDKINRWIGFIQGVAHMRGIVSSAEERERTRPIFHAAYAAMSATIPPTTSRTEN